MAKFKQGDIVDTPEGKGRVDRVYTSKKILRVSVGGQIYDFEFKDCSLTGEFVDTKPQVVSDYGFSYSFGGGWVIDGEEAKSKPKEKKMEQVKQLPDALNLLLGSLDEEIKQRIDGTIKTEMKELHALAKKNAKLEVKVASKTRVVDGARHKQLEELITIGGLRLPMLVVGMAGTGKTHAAEQVATALGLKFYTMSVGAQTSKSDIIGYMNANGEYVKTFFREAYEKGGVFLMDEIDAGNANVLIQVNAALSNGLAAFPDKMIKRHKDFVFVASANTYGTGMNREYVGRNQLDAATLDRFTVVNWDIDTELEGTLATGKHGAQWFKAVNAARDYVKDHKIRALITPRATQKGSQLLSAGMTIHEVIRSTLLGSVPEDKKDQITEVALKVFASDTAHNTEDIFI